MASRVLLIVGVLGVLASALLTHAYWNRAGLGRRSWIPTRALYEARSASAGRGIVPSYVSLLNLTSWGCLLLGGAMLLYSWLTE